jgi:hypothetical protein
LSKENALLELQMRNKFLKKEMEQSQKADTKPQDNDVKSEMAKIDKEIKQLQMEIELLQNKHNLFIAKQADNEEFREQAKRNFEITNKKTELDAKIELAKKEIELKNIEMARDKVIEDNKVEYLENPLLKNGTLVLSDRQIHIGRHITKKTAEKVENDIDFFDFSGRSGDFVGDDLFCSNLGCFVPPAARNRGRSGSLEPNDRGVGGLLVLINNDAGLVGGLRGGRRSLFRRTNFERRGLSARTSADSRLSLASN